MNCHDHVVKDDVTNDCNDAMTLSRVVMSCYEAVVSGHGDDQLS